MVRGDLAFMVDPRELQAILPGVNQFRPGNHNMSLKYYSDGLMKNLRALSGILTEPLDEGSSSRGEGDVGAQLYRVETSAKVPPVILSETKDLVFSKGYEILQSLRSFRMTIYGTFAEVSSYNQKAI
jgi:hypothetical protein